MRRIVYGMDTKGIYGPHSFMFKGVSAKDLANYYKKLKLVDNTWLILQEIPYVGEFEFSIPFGSLSPSQIYKENKWMDHLSGTDVFLQPIILDPSWKQIKFQEIEKNLHSDFILQRFDFFAMSHDYDWNMIVFFKEETWIESFIKYIQKHCSFVETPDEKDFQ